jgi:hypothetical protein
MSTHFPEKSLKIMRSKCFSPRAKPEESFFTREQNRTKQKASFFGKKCTTEVEVLDIGLKDNG